MQNCSKWLWISMCFLMLLAVGCGNDEMEDGDVDGDEEVSDGDNETIDGDNEAVDGDDDNVDGDEEVAEDETEDEVEQEVEEEVEDETEEEGEEEVDLCDNVDCGSPGICVESISCNPDNGQCDIIVYESSDTVCDSDDLICNGTGLCDGSGTCTPQNNSVTCTGNLSCAEPDGTCECLAPYHVEGDSCVGPNLLASMDDLSLDDESYWNGSDGSGSFTSGVVTFNNSYDSQWQSWNGWAYSNITDTTTAGFNNQYSAYAGGGSHGSANYAVAYDSYSLGFGDQLSVIFDDTVDGYTLSGMYVTNTTYAYLYMLNGDDNNDPFGGQNGTDEDWYMLKVTGVYADTSSRVSDPYVEFYLADFRFANSEDDYIISDWTYVDLSSLGNVIGLKFEVSSSDVGSFGMNNPTYFAVDGITKAVETVNFEDVLLGGEESYYNGSDMAGGFQSGNLWLSNTYEDYGTYTSWSDFACSNMTDTTTAGYENQYSVITGSGYDSSANFAIATGTGDITLEIIDAGEGVIVDGFYVTNTTYSYLYMMNGDQFGGPFGGESGNDEDWFLLTVTGIDDSGTTTGTVEFYLADYRFADNSQDYAVDSWTFVNLSSLGDVTKLRFNLTSSDVGDWGMNNPAYFAFDDLMYQIAD